MAKVLALVPESGLDIVMIAVELALEQAPPSGRVSVEHLVNVPSSRMRSVQTERPALLRATQIVESGAGPDPAMKGPSSDASLGHSEGSARQEAVI